MLRRSLISELKSLLRAALPLVAVLTFGIHFACSIDFTGPDPDLPDLAGDWLISVSGVGPTGPSDALNGSCELDAFGITVRRNKN